MNNTGRIKHRVTDRRHRCPPPPLKVTVTVITVNFSPMEWNSVSGNVVVPHDSM